MKLKAAIAAVLTACLLSGCNITGLDAQTLMRPPKATGDREAIHTALEESVQGNLILKYPTRGEYRSAITMYDLTGDGVEEAIAFCEAPEENSGIQIAIVGKQEEEWSLLGTFVSTAMQVDQVAFGDIDGDGRNEVVVGWGSALSGANSISVYSWSGQSLTETVFPGSYSEMAVLDFTGDGRDEIFAARLATTESPIAEALIMNLQEGTPTVCGSAILDSTVTKYVSISKGFLEAGRPGIVLDGQKNANTYITEVLYWDADQQSMKAPFMDTNSNYTERNIAVLSQDINNDSLIEIPIVSQLPGTGDSATDENAYLTNWYHYDCDENTVVRIFSTSINATEGYRLMIPEAWRGRITTQTTASKREVTFYEWVVSDEYPNGVLGQALLQIRVFTGEEWENSPSGYTILGERDNKVYAMALPHPENELSMQAEDVLNSFTIIV